MSNENNRVMGAGGRKSLVAHQNGATPCITLDLMTSRNHPLLPLSTCAKFALHDVIAPISRGVLP